MHFLMNIELFTLNTHPMNFKTGIVCQLKVFAFLFCTLFHIADCSTTLAGQPNNFDKQLIKRAISF